MEATQDSTQPCTDPRRMGLNNSGLHEEDVSDIICILHPNSHSAHDAVAATAAKAPQHILQREELEYGSPDTAVLDIALRLSSNIRDPSAGFCFGRNPSRCDILLSADDSAKRISNTHFRIHLTSDGILMLQDSSTNGTVVDDCRLRKGSKESSRMLTSGSVIQVVCGGKPLNEVRFVVRIPSREGFAREYTQNLIRYFERIQKHEADNQRPKNPQVPSQPALQWTVGNTFGMHWTGGSIYNVTGQIGKGAFATVYKLATKQHGMVYAAKELDKRRFMKNGVLDQRVDNEMKIMKDLKHPNIVQYIDHHEHDRWIYIIMEYVPGGELSTYLQSHGKIPEDMVKTITRQLLHALQYLHKRKITHRDIKPDNILIASLDPLKVKLSDFGLSKVVQEETILKTFCGTLLYCAPEVYPEYQTYRRGEARKRRRLGDPPPKTSPYGQSVDMWSLGAVLFHILCGDPPYMGRGDDKGAQMLRNIMTMDPDFDLLRNAGVSEEGIDFVHRLLNRDPLLRPDEQECFKHPWIVNVADVDEYDEDDLLFPEDLAGLSDIGEDLEDELDASQLSLYDKDNVGLAENVNEQQDATQVKRRRFDYPSVIHYPSLPNVSNFDAVPAIPKSSPRRLFGEITTSARRSSAAFQASLDAFEGDDFSVHDFVSSTGESMSDSNSLYSVISLPENPFCGSAPSLMGAENLVGQLNMNSSPNTYDPPALEAPIWLLSPGQTKRVMATNNGSNRDRRQVSLNDATPKAPKFSRRIELPLPETSSEHSSLASTRGGGTRQNLGDFHATTKESLDQDLELALTLDARTGREVTGPPETTNGDDYDDENDCYDNDDDAADNSGRSHDVQIPPTPESVVNSKSRRLLGKLTTVPGSIFDLTIELGDRMTSWGRGPHASVCYLHPMDTRIPAYALEVTFWAPAIESRIAAGEDWMKVPGVMTILSTKASRCIWVNDTELRRGPKGENGKQGFHFGKLYSGDIITVYKYKDKFLKFHCEFYHGDSARPRPEKEKGFVVRRVLMSKEDVNANRVPVRRDSKDDGK